MKQNDIRLLLMMLLLNLFVVGCGEKNTKSIERSQYIQTKESDILPNTEDKNIVTETKYNDITTKIENTRVSTENQSIESENQSTSTENQSTEINDIVTTETDLEKSEILDNMDYSSYLKKIWIVDGMDEDAGWGFPISLVITQIENGRIEGYVTEGGMVASNYFKKDFKQKYLNAFIGNIYNNEARCQYNNKKVNGNEVINEKRLFKLCFYEINRLKAELDNNIEETYELRPYNVSDHKYLNSPTIIETDLDLWGHMYLFYANMNSNHSIPIIFLLDEQGDILYQFSAAYHHASEVYNVTIEDINGDGLKDIKVTTYFSYMDEGSNLYEWMFYQKKDGFFTYPDKANIIEN